MKRKDREMISKMKSNISKEDAEKIRKDNVAKKRVEKRTKVRKNLMVFGALILIALIAVGVILIINNAGGSDSTEIPKPVVEKNIATIATSEGDIVLELLPGSAPETVENFKELAGDGHYNDSFFHRIVKGNSIECALNQNSPERIGFDDTMPVENSGVKAEEYFVSTILQPSKDGQMKKAFFRINKGVPDDLTQVGTVFGYVKLGIDVVDKILEAEVVKHEADNYFDVPEDEVSYPADTDAVKIFSITFSKSELE